MYNVHTNGLGEDPVAAEPSMWDNILKLGTNVVTSGFNIYNKVQNLTQQQKQTATAQTQVQLAQQAYMRPQLQPVYGQQSDFFSGWTIPLLVAGVAVVGFIALRRK